MKINNIFLGLLILVIFYALFKRCNKNNEMFDNDNSDNKKKIEIEMTNNKYKDFKRYLDFKNKSYKDDGGYNGSNYMSDDDDDQDDDNNDDSNDNGYNDYQEKIQNNFSCNTFCGQGSPCTQECKDHDCSNCTHKTGGKCKNGYTGEELGNAYNTIGNNLSDLYSQCLDFPKGICGEYSADHPDKANRVPCKDGQTCLSSPDDEYPGFGCPGKEFTSPNIPPLNCKGKYKDIVCQYNQQ